MRFNFGRWRHTATAVLASAAILLAGLPLQGAAASNAKDYEQQKKELEQSLAAADKKIRELAGQSGKTSEYLNAIEDKMDLAQQNLELLKQKQEKLDSELEGLNREISLVSQQVEQTEKEVYQKQLSFDDRYRAFSDRLCAMYVSGTPSTLEAFLSAEDFSGFLMSAELLSSVSKADREALEQLIRQMDDIRTSQKELAEKKETLSRRQEELLATKQELETARDENKKAVAAYEKEEQAAKQELEKNGRRLATLEDERRLNAKILAAIEEANRKEEEEANKPKPSEPTNPENPDKPTKPTEPADPAPPSSSGMTWPAPKCPYITTYFNPEGINGRRHRGVDLASAGNAMGLPIVAAESGEVIFTDVGGWGDSYGSYMIIRHANGLSTLYAHCSEVWVRKGQKVKKGEQIGRVGNTGNSRGAHLHFEVRDRSGSGRLNPLNYIKWGR